MTSDLERLERTLRRNRTWLRKFLDDPQRLDDNLHLLVAARLRLLLCSSSGDKPALLEYADKAGRLDDLVVWGPYRTFAPEAAVWNPDDLRLKRGHPVSYPVQKYLADYVGMYRIKRGTVAQRYTPRDLIKWVANAESLHHIPAGDEKVKNLASLRYVLRLARSSGPGEAESEEYSEETLAEALFSLGEWAVHAIDHVLV